MEHTPRSTSVSIGRGRGHVNTDRREQLRRPEQKFVSQLENIALKITELNTHSRENLEAIRNDIFNYCVTEGKLKILVNDLHERSLVNRPFGVKCAAALGTQSQLSVEDKKLRTILMQNVQTDFGDKETLHSEDISRFMNMVSFLGQVFRHVRLVGKSPIVVLADALIEYFKMLIDGSEYEVELVVQQLALNGKTLKELRQPQMLDLQVMIRAAGMTPGRDARSLGWLHLACDLERSNYAPLSSELRGLYDSKLGKGPMATLINLLTAPDPIILDDVVDTSQALNGLDLSSAQPITALTSPVSPGPTARHTSKSRAAKHQVPALADNCNGYGDALPQRKPTPQTGVRENTFPLPDPRTSRNPAGDFSRKPSERDSGRGAPERKGYNPRNDSRNDPLNWLPQKEPIPEKDLKAWDLQRRPGNNDSWGHDDRFDKDDSYYASQGRGKTNANAKGENWRAAKGTKEGNKYGFRNFDEPASQPLPSTGSEDIWD